LIYNLYTKWKDKGISWQKAIIRRPKPTVWEASVLERRGAKRFEVEWDVNVRGTDSGGVSFEEAGALNDLSSNGAFLYLSRQVKVGHRLEVRIRVPFKRENWMKYSAEVVRVEEATPRFGVAMKFDTPRPTFFSG